MSRRINLEMDVTDVELVNVHSTELLNEVVEMQKEVREQVDDDNDNTPCTVTFRV
jgi:hypothetical protein